MPLVDEEPRTVVQPLRPPLDAHRYVDWRLISGPVPVLRVLRDGLSCGFNVPQLLAAMRARGERFRSDAFDEVHLRRSANEATAE